MNFLDRRTRINILQQRANAYNADFDQLEQEGKDLDEIPDIIRQREEAKKIQINDRDRNYGTLPFEENTKVIGVGNAFQQGYQGSHKVISSTKQQFQEVDNFTKTYKKDPNHEMIQKFKEQQKKQQEVDKLSKSEIQKDHLTAMLNIGQKVPQTNFQDSFQYNDQFQKLCDNQSFEYNYKKNDLKNYAEEYVKTKANLRK